MSTAIGLCTQMLVVCCLCWAPPRHDNKLFRVVFDFWRPHWSVITRRDEGWRADVVTPAPREDQVRGVWELTDTLDHLVWPKHVCTKRNSLVFVLCFLFFLKRWWFFLQIVCCQVHGSGNLGQFYTKPTR